MYDYKTLRRVVLMLAILFGVVLLVLVVSSLPLSGFGWISVVLMVTVGGYFTTIPLKLIKELQDMEKIVESYKKEAQKRN